MTFLPSTHTGLRTWIQIDRRAIEVNYKTLRGLLKPSMSYMSVVKSNAYGHGLVDFSKIVNEIGVDWFGVDSAVEALRLRKEGILKPILVLGYTLPEMIPEAVEHKISLTVSHAEHLQAVARVAKKYPVTIHIKVDTGMHRQGFLINEIETVISFLKNNPNIVVEGLFTHFAAAKNPSHPDFVLKQMAEFKKWQEAFASAGFRPMIHVGASAGAIGYPEFHFDMVRLGISQYGHWPALEVQSEFQKKFSLQPVLSWKTIISEIKKVSAGERIGYDLTHTLERNSIIAVCPIGYWHGFSRSLSGKASVLVRGNRTNVLGKVSMDMITIDVTDISAVAIGDIVTLIGSDGEEEMSAEELSALSGTTSYEFLTRLNPLIKKILI